MKRRGGSEARRGRTGGHGRPGLLGLFGRMRPLSDVMAADSVLWQQENTEEHNGGKKKTTVKSSSNGARNEALI